MALTYRWILAAALFLGVMGDFLFNGAIPGLNVLLWVTAITLVSWPLRRAGDGAKPAVSGLVGIALFFAACVAWRASPFLRFWNVSAILAAGVTIAVQLRGRITQAWPADYLRGAGGLGIQLAGGLGAAAVAAQRPGRIDAAISSRARAVGIGVALTLPVVFVFGALLTSADPVLETFVRGLFDWDLGFLVEHALLILLLAWIAAGWLRDLTARREVADSSPMPPPRTFGLIEIATPLGALAVLLAAFIGLQGRYLFGGDVFVQSTGLTYAEFARRGFFELVFVSALVIPLLYIAQWVIDRGGRAAEESFRALVVVLAVLVGLVIVSALARMRLYVAAYGQTEDRLYATAFMIWIAGTLAWFVVTEVRAQPNRFATGTVLFGFAVVAALNVLNPDGFVARTNIARAQSGLELDPEYLGRLSIDAAPAVVAAWPALDVAARCALRESMMGRVRGVEDWREWNWARAAAARATARLPASDDCPEPSPPDPGQPPGAPEPGS